VTALTLIGGGNIATALLAGLARGGRPLGDVAVVERDPARAAEVRDRFGVTVAELADAVPGSELVMITVKPHHVDALLADLDPHVTDGQLVATVAGGITTEHVEQRLRAKAVVVRCMPNTAMALGQGMTALNPGSRADAGHVERLRALLEPVTRVVGVPEEQLDIVTALSGSGPAYFAYLAEALIDAGVLLGLTRPVAEDLVKQTAAGAGLLLRDSGDDPVRLRAAVSSPGGATMAAIRQLENRAVRAAVMAAVEAGRNRAIEMGGRAVS
jgi:pyrroline-5-carboxylate reductase